VALERVIRDLIEQDADPPADSRPSSRWCSENIAKQPLPCARAPISIN
jgi:hypothetical protein